MTTPTPDEAEPVDELRERLEDAMRRPIHDLEESGPQDAGDLAVQGIANAPFNPFNEAIHPVPTQVKQGVIESNMGPAGALTFMHPAGEYTFLTQDPEELDQLIAQISELKAQLATAALKHMLTNPVSGLVVPTPKVPGANGARLI